MTRTLVLLAVVACSRSDEKKPSAAVDPWATPTPPTAPTAADPWAAKPTAGEPTPPAPVTADEPAPPVAPQAADGASALAGRYQCLQLRYGLAANGMRQSSYVGSALGVFEIDGDGTYRSESYPTKGAGRVRADATTVAFEGGPYANDVGQSGTNTSGSFYIRFSENLTEAPAPSLRFNDHMCYRK